MASMVASRSWSSGTLAPATTTASGRPCPSTRRELFTPPFARSVGFGPTRPPLFGPCPSPRLRPATPSPPRRGPRTARSAPPTAARTPRAAPAGALAPPDQPPPQPREPPEPLPPLERAMDRAVIRILFGQPVPLA